MATPNPPAAARRFLVTAGNTRERIDAVRDWGNIFTGNTGYAIATALAQVGPVDLLTSNRQHLAALRAGGQPGGARPAVHPIRATGFTTHEELKWALAALMGGELYHGVFMTAAVADYRPERVYEVTERRALGDGREAWVVRDAQAGKVRSSYGEIAVRGVRTEKLVDLFRTAWGYHGLLVKFKLEVGVTPEALVDTGQASRAASGADYLVANTLDMVDGPGAGAYLLSDHGHEWVPRAELPARLVRLVREAVGSHGPPPGQT